MDFFSFVGSAKVGWTLRSKLSPGTRCALEHGGAAPVIIDKSVDIDEALPLIAKGVFIMPVRFVFRCNGYLFMKVYWMKFLTG